MAKAVVCLHSLPYVMYQDVAVILAHYQRLAEPDKAPIYLPPLLASRFSHAFDISANNNA